MKDGPWKSLLDCLEHHTTNNPTAHAILAPKRGPLSYEALFKLTETMHQALRDGGIGSNDRVAIVLPNGPELATAFISISASAACAPLNPAYGKEEFEFYLSDLDAKALIVAHTDNTPARAAAETLGIRLFELEPIIHAPAGLFKLHRHGRASAVSDTFSGLNDVALLLHTSGTTSRPKLVPLSHTNLCASAMNIMTTLHLTPSDRCLGVMPLFHIHGLVGATLSSLSAGASICCCPSFNAEAFFAWMEECQPSWYSAVPTIHQAVLAQADTYANAVQSSHLRFIRSSSSALPPPVMEQLETLFECPVIESYGMTEAAHQMASNPLPPKVRKPGSVGLAAGPDVAIMDAHGQFLKQGETAEVVIRGENVTSGYENNPHANAVAFTDGWFRTGDQGFIDADGYLTLTGRLKEIINRGGEKISPREVDEALLEHPAVRQAVCFAVPHPRLGEDVAVAVICVQNADVTPEALRLFVMQRLADFKVPSQVIFVDAIPKGPTGKIQRMGLAKKLRHLLVADYEAPLGSFEQTLTTLWTALLEIEQLGVCDNVFSIGADSLLAARAMARINAEFSIQLPIEAILKFPTIKELAACVEDRIAAGDRLEPIQKRAEPGEAPASYGQERLWLLDNLEADLIGHNRPTIMRLRGPFDLCAMRDALRAVIKRHQVLRTSYHVVGGRLFQRVEDAPDLDLPVLDLEQYTEDEQIRRSIDAAIEESRKTFDLRSGELFRVLLTRLHAKDHILIITSHHICFDAWSQSVLYRELAELYAANIKGRAASMPDLPIQYVDFAAWQRTEMPAATFEQGLDYWEHTIGRSLSILELPLDRPRPAAQSFAGKRRFIEIAPYLRDRLLDLSTQRGVTLFTTLLSVYATILHRYSGQPEILIGAPFAGRDRYETEVLIGLFINTVPLYCDFSDNPTFEQLLQRQGNVLMAAQTHRSVPFQLVVQRLMRERDLSRSPLFQALLIFESLPPSPRRFGDLLVEPLEIDFGKALLDISLELMDTPEGLHGHFEYATDLFDESSVDGMVRSFMRLLEEVVHDPSRTVGCMPLAQELTLVQQGALRNKKTPRVDITVCGIHEFFDHYAGTQGSYEAVRSGEFSLTYAELKVQSEQLAACLMELGVQPGSYVGICLERGVEMIVGILAVLKAGAAYVPLDPAYPVERIAYMLADTKAVVAITQVRLKECLPAFNGEFLCIDDCAVPNKGFIPHRVSLADAAYVIYTSGSTGDPKGVVVSHANLISAFQAWDSLYELNSTTSSILQTTSFSFDVSSGDWIRALCSGGRLTIASRDEILDAPALLRLIRSAQITLIDMNKNVLQNLLQHLRREGEYLDSVRIVALGGEPWLPAEFAEVMAGLSDDAKLINAYGVTEATVDNTYYVYDRTNPPHTPIVPIGLALPNSHLYVVDSSLHPVPDNVCGELCIGGPSVAVGYLNQPELTARKFATLTFHDGSTDRVYLTGDRVRRLSDGNLEYLWRTDRQMKIRGFRVEAGEVETALRAHEKIQEAVIVDWEADDNSVELAAYIVVEPGFVLSPEHVRTWMRQCVPSQMVPTTVTPLASLPRSPAGKLDRRRLPEPERVVSIDEGNNQEEVAQSDIARLVMSTWADVLNLEELSYGSSFFDIGGDSLSAMRVMNQLRDELCTDVPLRLLFESPVLREFTDAVEQLIQHEIQRKA